jgi:hypothetical protein
VTAPNVRQLSDSELQSEYRDALARAANAARQAALLLHLMEGRGLSSIKTEEPAEVDSLLLQAGRVSVDARSEAAVFA